MFLAKSASEAKMDNCISILSYPSANSHPNSSLEIRFCSRLIRSPAANAVKSVVVDVAMLPITEPEHFLTSRITALDGRWAAFDRDRLTFPNWEILNECFLQIFVVCADSDR